MLLRKYKFLQKITSVFVSLLSTLLCCKLNLTFSFTGYNICSAIDGLVFIMVWYGMVNDSYYFLFNYYKK